MASTLQPLERRLGDLLDVFWPAVESSPLAAIVRIGFPPELGRDDDFSAKWSERLADQFFVYEWAIHFGCVEKRDASFHRRMEQGRHLLLVLGRTVGPAHSHAAQTDGGYFEATISNLPYLHLVLSFVTIRQVPLPRLSKINGHFLQVYLRESDLRVAFPILLMFCTILPRPCFF